MSIVFDEIVGTVTDDPQPQPEEPGKKKKQRPLPQKTLRQIDVHQRRQQRLQARLLAD